MDLVRVLGVELLNMKWGHILLGEGREPLGNYGNNRVKNRYPLLNLTETGLF